MVVGKPGRRKALVAGKPGRRKAVVIGQKWASNSSGHQTAHATSRGMESLTPGYARLMVCNDTHRRDSKNRGPLPVSFAPSGGYDVCSLLHQDH
jgi:hypothetical protein